MKKTALFSTLFLAVFGLTLGITLMTYQPAAARPVCGGQCMFDTYCSYDAYPACDVLPYVVYKSSACEGGPFNCPRIVNEPVGCWDGVPPCIYSPFEMK